MLKGCPYRLAPFTRSVYVKGYAFGNAKVTVTAVVVSTDSLLLETSDYLLLETGDKLLLE